MTIEKMKDRLDVVLKEYMAVRESYYKEPTDSPKLKELATEWDRLEKKLNNLRCKIRDKEWQERKEHYGC